MSVYAAIYRTEEVRLDGRTVKGLAYPELGPLCGALQLLSGDRVIGATRADQFSLRAATKNLRDGWCAFSVKLRPADFILSDIVTLRCLKSGAMVFEVEYSSVDWGPERETLRRHTSIEALLRPQSYGETCDARSYFALIERTTKAFDDRRFIEFVYKLLLKREVDSEALDRYLRNLLLNTERHDIFDILTSSSEYTLIEAKRFLSPYDEDFPVSPVFAPVD